MGTEVTLLTIYDRLAGIDGKLGAYMARTDERLEHGSRQLRDYEDRLRALEEQSQRRRGGLGVLGTIGAIAGSNVTAALLTLLVSHR